MNIKAFLQKPLRKRSPFQNSETEGFLRQLKKLEVNKTRAYSVNGLISKKSLIFISQSAAAIHTRRTDYERTCKDLRSSGDGTEDI